MVEMEVNGQQDEFLSEGEEDEERDSEASDEEGMELQEENEDRDDVQCTESESESENEISFIDNTNRSNSCEQEKLSSDDTEISKEEEMSMRKFAIFLEKNGFIRQENKANEEEPQPQTSTSGCSGDRKEPNKPANKGKKKKLVKENTSVQKQPCMSGSEMTIYRDAVEMYESNSDSDNCKNNRISTSSEEGELINTSDELCGDLQDQRRVNGNKNENEQILYQKILDYCLSEQREVSRKGQKEDQCYTERRQERSRGCERSIDERCRSRDHSSDRRREREKDKRQEDPPQNSGGACKNNGSTS